MTNTSKTVVGIIVAIIVILGLYLIFVPSTPSLSDHATTTEPTSTVSATDTSDAALSQDMNNVDAQSSSLNSDNANADAGISQTSY